ncbi:uncharacterized protein K452DRAFT_265228 [Aplosporella prunicola CBS 121167]|uniref:Uncharacterized protein n=1 Tax=Aplosporella prunicola CBS 121167 TaxID=1176127 RepID=A0A6A6BP59_9PEZI|nr:uncharacterized protein K452DRAFT_265228 [Aplosporella prunicola CBS 121167]KAF2145856.1 hypothetical protein K452DRAFT_265228 [Aplosporella prunicola CBS 121167]
MKSSLQALLLAGAAAAENATAPSYLTATAIVTNAQNNSALQCWRFSDALQAPTTPGIIGAQRFGLDVASGAELAVIPPRFDGQVHNAPVPAFVSFASGLAHLSLPHGADEAWILGGENGLIVAVDTTGSGHRTRFPSDETTISLFLPFLDARVPPHEVLSEGPCFYHRSQIVGGGEA